MNSLSFNLTPVTILKCQEKIRDLEYNRPSGEAASEVGLQIDSRKLHHLKTGDCRASVT